jgi:hypothetical protein
VEGKFEMIADALTLGVDVDRDEPDNLNGVTWRVTFLDQSPAGANNFNVAVNSASLTVDDEIVNNPNLVTVTELVAGEEYISSCVGTHQVPSSGALVTGQNYWARVFAVNALGMSSAQVSPSSEKPMVVPGHPLLLHLKWLVILSCGPYLIPLVLMVEMLLQVIASSIPLIRPSVQMSTHIALQHFQEVLLSVVPFLD